MRQLGGITDSVDMSLSKLGDCETGKPAVLQPMRSQKVGHDSSTEQGIALYCCSFPTYLEQAHVHIELHTKLGNAI